MKFKKLTINDWRQFKEIDINFHPRLTILAGANGAGKSTILRALSQSFGFQFNLIATPRQSNVGVVRYFSGVLRKLQSAKGFSRPPLNPALNGNYDEIGSVIYSNNESAKIKVPDSNSVTYNIFIENQIMVDGLFIQSHRPISDYQQITNIPANPIDAQQAYQLYHQEVLNRYSNSYTNFSPTYRIKEAIISMATFGPGNENVRRNSVIEKYYRDFKQVLARVLPQSIGFQNIEIRMPDVVLVTETGEFLIDASSGGLMAIIDIAWQIFLYSRGRKEFVAVIDEPENHLHPSMQRVIIANLLKAFPDMQLIVATHSPFVVSSVQDSSVYVLGYVESRNTEGLKRSVTSQLLDNVNKAGTASEILRNVLGVPVTMPLWAEDKIESVVSNFNINDLNAERISQLRKDLEQLGLGEFYSDALAKIAGRQ